MLEPCALFKHEGQVVEIRGNIGGVNVVQALPDFGQFPLGNLVSAPDAAGQQMQRSPFFCDRYRRNGETILCFRLCMYGGKR